MAKKRERESVHTLREKAALEDQEKELSEYKIHLRTRITVLKGMCFAII